MRERNEMILTDLIAARAEAQPDRDVLTFERWSISDGAQPDEVRTYATLHENANRIAAALVRHGMTPGERFGLMMRNHPAFVETTETITGIFLARGVLHGAGRPEAPPEGSEP